MVYLNEHYYLVCNLLGKPCTSLYRIDRIKDISVLDSEWDKQPESDSEIENAVYAFTGKAEYIKMRCDKVILNDAVDQFGMSAKIRDLNENEFELTVKVPPRGVKFWALQYLPYVEVIEPLWLREEVIESIKGNKYDV